MTGKLVLTLDGVTIREYPLEKERLTIGRKSHNDIQVDNLAVSGEHAAVITILNDSFMEDLGSTNGTAVNGQVVKKHFLQNGDVIELGKHKLKYVNDAPPNTTAEDFERTMVLRRAPGVKDGQSADVLAAKSPPFTGTATRPPVQAPVAQAQQPPPVRAHEMLGTAAIQLLNGANVGKTLEITKTLTTLGKPGVQVAVITKRPSGYFLTHIEGTAYPLLNGVALSAQASALSDHDIIDIAGVKMEFFLKK